MADDDERKGPSVRAVNGLPPQLRRLLVAWRRARITEANELSELLDLPRFRAVKRDDE